MKKKGGRTEGKEKTFISFRPPSLLGFAANRQKSSLPLGARSSAQEATQPALCRGTKCSSCHPCETEHICSEMFSAFPDLGHGNLRTFPNPGLISLIQLDYGRMQLTKGTYYLLFPLAVKIAPDEISHGHLMSFVIQLISPRGGEGMAWENDRKYLPAKSLVYFLVFFL